jgi:hypothetical protein
MGDPDGALYCDVPDCRFYAGRLSALWFAYAVWMDAPDRIYVREGDE